MTKAIWFDPKVVYPTKNKEVLVWTGTRMYVGHRGDIGLWYTIGGESAPNCVAWTPLPNAPLTPQDFGG